MHATLRWMTAGATLATLGCVDGTGPASLSAPARATSATVTVPTSGPWARIVEGETGPGSLYALYVPQAWNGQAVFYAHGFRDVTQAIDLRDQDQLFAVRDALGAEGYAVAYSSYSENGFAIKDGAQRTHQLRGILTSELGSAPTRNYLVGHSLGAAVSLSLAEQFAGQYDGALLMCGMVGGSLRQTQYLGHVRALFDFFYPGVIAGNVTNVPDGTTLTFPQLIAAISANPLGLFAIASTAQTPLPFVPSGNVTDPNSTAFKTLVGSLYGALVFQIRGAGNIRELTHGFSPFDNAQTTYTVGRALLPSSVLDALLNAANAGVVRYVMPPPAAAYLSQYFTPSGALSIPVLTVHNTWDPVVPEGIHEMELGRLAQDANASGTLLQRSYPQFGHCAIPASETLRGFHDLVGWVATGAKPAT